MIKLSLIQTSQNRINQVSRFVNSLNEQININFEEIQYIFVDQGDHLSAFTKLNEKIKFEYIKSDKCSLSHARNIALKLVKGTYVAFPDDDCWYQADTISKVYSILDCGIYDGVTCIGYNEKMMPTSTFPPASSKIKRFNLCAAISYTLFLRYEKTLSFDENMGVGSPHNIGSGEESDYLLTLLEYYNHNVFYDASIIVHHPAEIDAPKDVVALQKAYKYARGDGYLMIKHNMPLHHILKFLIRPFIGILWFTITIRPFEAKRSYYRLKGRIEGLTFKLK